MPNALAEQFAEILKSERQAIDRIEAARAAFRGDLLEELKTREYQNLAAKIREVFEPEYPPLH
jgi:hypothetical protein